MSEVRQGAPSVENNATRPGEDGNGAGLGRLDQAGDRDGEGAPLIVAIDGPAGAGKSTLASHLAARFGLLNLETGAMYRAFALKALEKGCSPDDAAQLDTLLHATSIMLVPDGQSNRVLLDGVDVTDRLREPEVTSAASRVSVHPAVRVWLVGLQRQLGQNQKGKGVVMEGRDIGNAVFPEAQVKIFLDASPEKRSERRYAQAPAGEPAAEAGQSREEVLRAMRERDQRDRNRAISPLRPAADATIIDSTYLTLDEVIAQAEAIVTERWAGARR